MPALPDRGVNDSARSPTARAPRRARKRALTIARAKYLLVCSRWIAESCAHHPSKTLDPPATRDARDVWASFTDIWATPEFVIVK